MFTTALKSQLWFPNCFQPFLLHACCRSDRNAGIRKMMPFTTCSELSERACSLILDPTFGMLKNTPNGDWCELDTYTLPIVENIYRHAPSKAAQLARQLRLQQIGFRVYGSRQDCSCYTNTETCIRQNAVGIFPCVPFSVSGIHRMLQVSAEQPVPGVSQSTNFIRAYLV